MSVALNDAKYLPRLSTTFLVRRTGLAESTVRYTLQRLAAIGHELSEADDPGYQALLTPR